MAKPAITKRQTKGSPLTYAELDTNFQNLDDATISLQAGTGGTVVASDLNGTITLVAGSGIVLAGDNSAKTVTVSTTESQNIFQNIAVAGQSTVSADTTSDTLTLVAGTNLTITTNSTTDTITINSLGGDVVNDTSPQLGGDLDVNGFKLISSASNAAIQLTPNGAGNIITETQNLIVGKASASTTAAISSAVGITVLNIGDGVNRVTLDENNGITLDTDPGKDIVISAGTGDDIELDGALKIRASTGTPTTYENGYYEDMLQTPVSWLKISIGGSFYYLPLFQ
jgi:hypothetical protein